MYVNISKEIRQMEGEIRNKQREERSAQIDSFKQARMQQRLMGAQKLQQLQSNARERFTEVQEISKAVQQAKEAQADRSQEKFRAQKKAVSSPQRLLQVDREKLEQFKTYQTKVEEAALHAKILEEQEQQRKAEKRKLIKAQENSVRKQAVVVKVNKKLDYLDYQAQRRFLVQQEVQALRKQHEQEDQQRREANEAIRKMQRKMQLQAMTSVK